MSTIQQRSSQQTMNPVDIILRHILTVLLFSLFLLTTAHSTTAYATDVFPGFMECSDGQTYDYVTSPDSSFSMAGYGGMVSDYEGNIFNTPITASGMDACASEIFTELTGSDSFFTSCDVNGAIGGISRTWADAASALISSNNQTLTLNTTGPGPHHFTVDAADLYDNVRSVIISADDPSSQIIITAEGSGSSGINGFQSTNVELNGPIDSDNVIWNFPNASQSSIVYVYQSALSSGEATLKGSIVAPCATVQTKNTGQDPIHEVQVMKSVVDPYFNRTTPLIGVNSVVTWTLDIESVGESGETFHAIYGHIVAYQFMGSSDLIVPSSGDDINSTGVFVGSSPTPVLITETIPAGLTYTNFSPVGYDSTQNITVTEVSVTSNANGTTTIVYDLQQQRNGQNSINIFTTVDSNISAGDLLTNSAQIYSSQDDDMTNNGDTASLEVFVPIDVGIGDVGDVNCDGIWGIEDSVLLKDYDLFLISDTNDCSAVDATALYLPACDINQDNRCDVEDALIIESCITGRDIPYCPEPIVVMPDVSIGKSADPTIAQPGDMVTFLLSVANTGVTTTTGGVTATDILPAGLTLVSSSPASVNGMDYLLPDLAPGEQFTIMVVTNVDTAVADGTTIQNTATVTTTGDTDPANNSDSATVTVDIPFGTILGSVTHLDGDPVQGAVVSLFDSSGSIIQTTTTNILGEYAFTAVVEGSGYSVSVDPATITVSDDADSDPYDKDPFTLPSFDSITVIAGGGTTVDFTVDEPVPVAVGSIGNFVYLSLPTGNVPLAGVTVILTSTNSAVGTLTAITDANGNYLFSNLPLGDYTVTLDVSSLPAGKIVTAINPINVTLTAGVLDVSTADFAISIDPTDPTDTDGDGLPDYWEITGDIDGDGVLDIDLPAMGADPNVPDIFVELDYMGGSYYRTHKPHPDAIRWVVEAFDAAGIHLHVDYGLDAPLTWGTAATWGALGKGNQLPFNMFVCTNQDENLLWDGFDTIKSANFDATARADIFHYNVWAHHLCDDYGTTSGISRGIGASDFIVSLGGWGRYGVGSIEDQAGTFMHELGHNLGLRHGGHENDNYKTNYFSVMNYLYQAGGISIAGQPIAFDYSGVTDPVLAEASINETLGLPAPLNWNVNQGRAKCPTPYSQFIVFPLGMTSDFNCNGSMSDLGMDINVDGVVGTLTTHDDWSNIVYGGGEVGLPANELGTPNDTVPNPLDGSPDLSRDEAECIRSASDSTLKPVEILMTEYGVITSTMVIEASGPKSIVPWLGDSNCGWVGDNTLFSWGIDGIGGVLDGTYVQASIGRQLIMIIVNSTTRSANRIVSDVDEFTIAPGVYNLKLSLLDDNGDEAGSDIIRIEVAEDAVEVIGPVTEMMGTVVVNNVSGNEIGREAIALNLIETAIGTIVDTIPDTVTISTQALINDSVTVQLLGVDGSVYHIESTTVDSELSETIIRLPDELHTYLIPLHITLSESGAVASSQLASIAFLTLLMMTGTAVYRFRMSR